MPEPNQTGATPPTPTPTPASPPAMPLIAAPGQPFASVNPEPPQAAYDELQRLIDEAEAAEISAIDHSPQPNTTPSVVAAPAAGGSSPAPPPAAPSAAQSPQPAAAPTPAPTITDAMIDRARSAGISAEEARSYDPATLERTLAIFERNWRTVAQHIAARTNAPAAAAQPNDPSAPAVPTPAASAPAAPPTDFQVTLDERLYDPEIVKQFKAMDAFYSGKMKALEAKVGKVDQIEPIVADIAQAAAQKAQQDLVTNVETWAAALGEDFHDVLGTEPVSKLAPGSPQREEYRKIGQTMDMLDTGAKSIGKPMSAKEAFDGAIRLLYGDRAAEKARAKAAELVAQQLRDQRGRFVQRPSEIHSPGVQDPEAEALAELRDIMRRENANGRY